MSKLVACLVVALGALAIVTPAGAPNRPPPNCPAGYSRDSGSTDTAVLCTRTVTNTVTREVRVEVPGPERIVEKIVEKRVEVPVEKIVYRTKVKRVVKWRTHTKIKRVRVVHWKTRTVYVNCPVPGQG